MEETVLCGANSYKELYYFNKEKFSMLPKGVQDELHAMCVLFTEEVGGIITLQFLSDGTLHISTAAADEDFYYDEIEAGLQVRKLTKDKQDLFEALELFYRTIFNGDQYV